MTNDCLHEISDILFNCLLLIRYNIFNENDIIKSLSNWPPESEKYLEISPLPNSHIKVLLYLQNCKSPSISQIGKYLCISKSNMTPIINNLLDCGLIKRYSDSDDKRIMRVELTDKANKVFNIFYKNYKKNICSKISKLSDNDIDLLKNSLLNLNYIFTKISET